MGKVVQMFSKQVMNFTSIHPIHNGMYFYRVRQLQKWAEYWDDLNDPGPGFKGISNRIGCNAALSGVADAKDYLKALLANILDGDGRLELHIEHNQYEIIACTDEGWVYEVRHLMNFGDCWINQGSLWRFNHPIEMLEAMFTAIHSGNWGSIPSKHLKTMQDA